MQHLLFFANVLGPLTPPVFAVFGSACGFEDWKEPPNLLGLADGLPPQLAQLAAECGKAASVRARPAGQKRLWVSGHESHKVDGFTVVAQRGDLADVYESGGVPLQK